MGAMSTWSRPIRWHAGRVAELIVYACPIGELAESLERYFSRALEECGHNAAHDFMPHVSLTGFFHDDRAAWPGYVDALGALIAATSADGAEPTTVTGMLLRDDFHLLAVESRWFQSLALGFRDAVTPSATRLEEIRPKEWLHLSLAYGFAAEQKERLAQLAQQWVRPDAACGWEIRLYERSTGNHWSLLAAWPSLRS